jgi:hypothetical protein
MAKKKTRRTSPKSSSRKTSSSGKGRVLAIIALILNILIFPGLGSLVGRKIKIGIWQFAIAVVGSIVWLIYGDTLTYGGFGAALIFAAWIWGIVTGIQIVKESI